MLEKEQFKREFDMSKYTIGIDCYDKQETLEEASVKYGMDTYPSMPLEDYTPAMKLNYAQIVTAFKYGAKWQQEKMYSDMQEYAEFCIKLSENGLPCITAKDWFEQFKINKTK